MAGKVIPISPSGLLDYEGCGKRFYHTKIVKTHRQEVTDALTHGNTVHKQLEDHVKHRKALPTHLNHVADVISDLRACGLELYAELEMAIDREWNPVGFWDKTAWLRGKIDLVALSRDEAYVYDYKTGKRKADFTQLQIYSAVVYHVLKLKKVTSAYMWLKTKEADSFAVDAGNIALIQQEITERIENAENAELTNRWLARTSPLCRYCPVLRDCAEAVYYKENDHRARR